MGWTASWDQHRRRWEPGDNYAVAWTMTLFMWWAWPAVPEIELLHDLVTLVCVVRVIGLALRWAWRWVAGRVRV